MEGGSRDARGDLSAETQHGPRPVCYAALTTGQETGPEFLLLLKGQQRPGTRRARPGDSRSLSVHAVPGRDDEVGEGVWLRGGETTEPSGSREGTPGPSGLERTDGPFPTDVRRPVPHPATGPSQGLRG